MTATLLSILRSIPWEGNIASAYADVDVLQRVEAAIRRVALWSAQLEGADSGNPALSFIRETQVAAHLSAASIGLCVYKSAASSSRTMLETGLYYSYFRTHPIELSTLVRLDKFYVSKSEILEYHKVHTPHFYKLQEVFGLVSRLEKWYSYTSAIVHGQLPGEWNTYTELSGIHFSEETHKLAVNCFLQGEEILHTWMLCTIGKSMWSSFSPYAKEMLLKGISGDRKTALEFDSK